MSDIEQIRRSLQMIASGTEDIEPPYRAIPPEYYRRIAADALPPLERHAARVGEDWCFDMEKVPKDGSDILGYWKGSGLYDVICWNDLRETKDRWETSDDACAMSPPTCWLRITPPEISG